MDNIENRASHSTLTFWIHWLVGMGLALGLFIVLAINKTGDFGPLYRIATILTGFVSIPVYATLRLYRTKDGPLTGMARLLLAWVSVLAILSFLGSVTKTTHIYSREVFLVWALAGYFLQVAAFLPLRALAVAYGRRHQQSRRSIIIGTGELAEALANRIAQANGEPILGFVAIFAEKHEHSEKIASGVRPPVIGQVVNLRGLIAEHEVQQVYIALPAEQTDQVEGLYIDLLDASVDVVWVPDLANFMLLNHSVRSLDGLPAIYLNESPLTSYPVSALLKNVIDRSGALIGIVLLSPLLVGVALAIKLTSPGPILFRQPRHGWNGQVFEVWKFRSMRVHDDTLVKQATRNDNRITPIGRFIRRTSIDELPQLFNVLMGDMSLVGPRPHAVQHNNYYSNKIRSYMARHRIKPGITGFAQVSGCRGETETIDKMERRVELDLEYINNWTLWLDIKILLKTPFTLLGKDIY